MAERSRRRPRETWDPETRVYTITHNQGLGWLAKLGLRSVEAHTNTSSVNVVTASGERRPGVITHVEATGPTEAAAKAAAKERFRSMKVSRGRRFSAREQVRPPEVTVPAQRQAEGGPPKVESTFTVVVPPQERDYSLSTETGNLAVEGTNGSMRAFSGTGNVQTENHTGNQHLDSTVGRITVAVPSHGEIFARSTSGVVFVNGAREGVGRLTVLTTDGEIGVTNTEVQVGHLESKTGPIDAKVTNADLHVYAQTRDGIRVRPTVGFTQDERNSGPRVTEEGLVHAVSGHYGHGATEKTLTIKSGSGEVEFGLDVGNAQTQPMNPHPPTETS